MVDTHTRECPLLAADTSLNGKRVSVLLDGVAAERGYPKTIQVDNGAELYSKAMDSWAYRHGVQLQFIQPHAKQRGLSTLLIEPVPLATELPSTPAEALRLMKDLDGKTDVPVRLLVDWGHALFKPLFKENASVDLWMRQCRDYIHSFHIQQTDGSLDCHWNFSRDGLVKPKELYDFWRRYGLTTQTYVMEIVYPFEAEDDFVLRDMIRSTEIIKKAA